MTTKLILTNEVTGLGTAGDVVEVKDGYARNFLLPETFPGYNADIRPAQFDLDAAREAFEQAWDGRLTGMNRMRFIPARFKPCWATISARSFGTFCSMREPRTGRQRMM